MQCSGSRFFFPLTILIYAAKFGRRLLMEQLCSVQKELAMTKIYSYVLRYDEGAAPNPFGNVCTLAICKPVIRRAASVGDWVVGTGSKVASRSGVQHDFSECLVYAMKVTRILTMAEYDTYCREQLPVKVADRTGNWMQKLGDCIYDYSAAGQPGIRYGVHGERSRDRDLGGINVLLSDHFYYFGENPVFIPAHLTGIIKTGPGHKKDTGRPLIMEFEKWIAKFGVNQLYGKPQVEVKWDNPDSLAKCEIEGCRDDKDETEEEV
jgi:hypothetical protein